ncbi:RagB/SusD family nutrient uptake outer membrane protein [Chitinophaga sancti]|uniref:RagB/SusD family nutrient uptake outer membrane protein n=1 Tax=Chitinophaga sancti TaxID=1004 RepID=A0A1K1SK63_9BACT|nr:RagB/SusD family nutrient uptake outer membrane protein [Chitinophaga sancti]WQD64505.1 RagB/SusD family nutrient uptake outer membrane protein [Chitinophaga sancti]WQG89871.1 RagB/SusD family nutrient uptake outer membrane protein [Chitinophaga sancti]SFW84556.1 SusD family protein [Chitinophaga sancti]
MYKVICFLLSIIVLTGCEKFLDVNPSTESVNPTTIADFQEMLNADSLAVGNYILTDLMSDDVRFTDIELNGQDNFYSRSYLWGKVVWNPADEDYMYNSSYTRILQMNIILNRINAAPQDSVNTEKNRSNVISQSLIQRSWYYLQLANIYGAAYNSATAGTDLAVPLVLSPDATAQPSRATVREVYYKVITDLKQAVNNPYLPALGKNIIHPGKAAGYALLSRAYLYMAAYDSASLYADSSLALASSLTDLRSSYSGPTQLIDLRTNPEVLMAKVAYEQNFYSIFKYSFQLSSSLYSLLSYNDGRYNTRLSGYFYRTTTYNGSTTVFSDFSVSVPEVMLTKAECLARKGDAAAAMALVNTLAATRIYNYTAVNASSADTALAYVLRERRRELFVHGGLRWFDLKRFNVNTNTQLTLTRKQDDSTVIASLAPLSSRYLVPFTQTVLANNPNMVQNVRQ